MSAPLLELRDVTKQFPIRSGPFRQVSGHLTAVDRVSLSIAKGDVLGLVGESGCGKTTLAKMIVQLEHPTSGTIAFNGQPLSGRLAPEVRRQIQLVFQDPTSSLNPRQRVGDAIAEPLLVHRVGMRADRQAAVAKLLEQVGLPANYARRYPRELSGGERQRVAIARSLSLEPSLLVLDEPVASLDVYVGAQVLELLRRLHQERGLAYLLISHDLRVIGSICQRVAVMYFGKLVEVAPAADIFLRPQHEYTKLLLESASLR